MDTNRLNLPKDFFKQFKNKEDFNDFFQSLFRGEYLIMPLYVIVEVSQMHLIR